MRIKILALGLVYFIILINCFGCTCNCDKEMDKVRNQRGSPEEVSTYTASDYNSVDWWYWSQGINYTFKWGKIVDGCCDVSTYTFTPIPADSSESLKIKIKSSKILVNRKINFFTNILK